MTLNHPNRNGLKKILRHRIQKEGENKMTKNRGTILLLTSLVLVLISGCATVPTGPSVAVYPAPGKAFEEFQADDAVCRQWAAQQTGITPQETINQNTAAGAVAGTAIGGGLGAAIGSAGGHMGTGAAIGAGTGLLFGTLAGSDRGYAYSRSVQRQYDIAYQQCMYAKGNQIPGVVEHRRPVYRRQPPPPPPPPDRDTPPADYPGNYTPPELAPVQ
jgi:uncharacterized protein YcfJ